MRDGEISQFVQLRTAELRERRVDLIGVFELGIREAEQFLLGKCHQFLWYYTKGQSSQDLLASGRV